MLFVGIILCYLLGLSILRVISKQFSAPELIAYSFLIGIGCETFILFLLDLVQLRYAQSNIMVINILLIAILNKGDWRNIIAIKDAFKMPSSDWKQINYVAVFLFLLIIWLLYTITVKDLYWPATERDSITSFDKLGRIMAIEGKLKISLFKFHLEGAGGTYPPLLHGSYAYADIFGAETAKIMTTLFFVSLLSSFYAAVKNYAGVVAAMLFTFVMLITPELYSHAALSLSNMPTTAYVCGAALSLLLWLDKREEKYFWLSAIMMGFTLWIRSDAIVFAIAGLVITAIATLRNKDYKHLILYAAMAFAPFVIWFLYVKFKIDVIQAGRFDTSMGFSGDRLGLMLHYVKAYFLALPYGNVHGGQLYGISFIAFFIALLVNLYFALRKGFKQVFDNRIVYLFLFFFVSFALYFIEFYLINEKVQAATIDSLMQSSFKRGMFYFIPLALYYTATCYSSLLLFEKLEKFRTASN